MTYQSTDQHGPAVDPAAARTASPSPDGHVGADGHGAPDGHGGPGNRPAAGVALPTEPSRTAAGDRSVNEARQAVRTLLKRAWRWLLPLAAGLAAAAVARLYGDVRAPHETRKLIAIAGAIGFLLLALVASFTLANEIRQLTRARLSAAHAGVLRLIILLGGGLASVLVTLGLLSIPIGQLVLGGALTGVVLGIAGQQTLANLFAGIVLLGARPFRVGERVQLRSGALGGTIEGRVVEIGLAYLHVDAAEGLLAIPNSQALSAVIAPPAATGSARQGQGG